MPDIVLHLAAVPVDDKEATLKICADMYRLITGKDPTPEDTAESRRTLGLPPVDDGTS
jgi:hypothetical protein